MRRALLAAFVPLIFLAQADHGQAQAQLDPRGMFFMVAATQINVTVARDGTGLVTLCFPKGTMVSVVTSDRQRPEALGPGAFRFRGAVELRILPAADVTPGPGHVLMGQAPMVLAAQDVDVILENVPAR
jgi:hypothetical protein